MAIGMTYNGKELKKVTYEDSYDFISTAVDGYIERVPISMFDSRDIDLWVNEEGKFRDFERTAVLIYKGNVYDFLMGNIAFTKHDDEGETISLTDEDVDFITKTVAETQVYTDIVNGNRMLKLEY